MSTVCSKTNVCKFKVKSTAVSVDQQSEKQIVIKGGGATESEDYL